MKVDKVFTCPQCGGHRLEEVMVGVISYSEVTDIEQTDTGLACEYGETTHDEGELARFQCLDCRHVVAESEDDLAEFLKLA
jgi:transcription elongation factor Elf1